MSHTKMVFTLGPATDKPEILRALIKSGMDCARFNFSHGTHAEHAARFQQLKQESQKLGKTVATLMDLSGPKIRCGQFLQGGIALRQGMQVRITNRAVLGAKDLIPVACPGLRQAVKPGDQLLFADGMIRIQVLRLTGQEIVGRVTVGGILKDHQGLNLPGVVLKISALTTKDRKDLIFGLGLGMDYAALSFVRHPQDILLLRKLIRAAKGSAGIIAKIEKPEAIPHLEAIIQASDGIMIARGDLGVEMGPEEVPTLQKKIISLANQHGRFVITATQMLQSMVDNPAPTRAEASDVANAIFDGTDAVMLSGESAAGAFPREAAAMMQRIINQAESYPEYNRLSPKLVAINSADQLIAAGVRLAEELHASAVVVFTQSGDTARLISRRRPRVPIYALAHSAEIYQKLQIWWGVEPLLIRSKPVLAAIVEAADHYLLARTSLRLGQQVVIMASAPVGVPTNFLKVHTLGQKRIR